MRLFRIVSEAAPMVRRLALLGSLIAALSVGVATANAAEGNSGNAKLCQNSGWQHWVRADHTGFTNEGDCVSYAAQGGTLTAPTPQSQLDCESFGGTYVAPGPGTIVWLCNGWPATDLADWTAKWEAMAADCLVETADAIAHVWSSTYIVPGANVTSCSALFA